MKKIAMYHSRGEEDCLAWYITPQALTMIKNGQSPLNAKDVEFPDGSRPKPGLQEPIRCFTCKSQHFKFRDMKTIVCEV
jgi:hypothetical protein